MESSIKQKMDELIDQHENSENSHFKFTHILTHRNHQTKETNYRGYKLIHTGLINPSQIALCYSPYAKDFGINQ